MHDKLDSAQDQSALAASLEKRPGFVRSLVASVGVEIVHFLGVT